MADPEYLGFLDQQPMTDVLLHAYRRESVHVNHPTVLENKDGNINMFYPDESLDASKRNNGLFPKYGLKDVNMFFRLKYI
jgi:hypothetical protein